jgi:hypothetical protein
MEDTMRGREGIAIITLCKKLGLGLNWILRKEGQINLGPIDPEKVDNNSKYDRNLHLTQIL